MDQEEPATFGTLLRGYRLRAGVEAASRCLRQVTVAPLFAEAIRSIFEETSISRLFE